MPRPQCKMVRGSFLYPSVEKCPDIGLEKTTRIGISRSWNRTRDGLSLRYDKLKSSIVRTADAQHRNRSFLDFKFYPGSKAWFAVVLFETSQHGSSLRNLDIVWAIVSHQDKALEKIYRVKFCKTSTNSKPVHDHHRHAGLEV